jgi:TolB-like protein
MSVCFDRYRFEPQTARLWADEREIKLTRKAAAVLGLLVACAGRPVTKAELFASVWSDRAVSDDALTTCIQELRRALGDDPRKPRYIETRHRSGYQFVAALSHAAGSAAPAPGVTALAVLPFTDMSAARDQEYFCDGLAEEVIGALANVDGLRVAARKASFQFRRPGLDIRQVGRQLGVEALLVGSVRKNGERLRITVQLIEAATGYHKWSHRFEPAHGDVFAIQDEIVQTVATSLVDAICRRSAVPWQPVARHEMLGLAVGRMGD